MALIDGSGETTGLTTVTGAAALLLGPGGLAAGTSTVTGTAGRYLLFTGQIHGTSVLEADLTTPVAGTAAGSGDATVTGVRIQRASGQIQGTSRLTWSYPYPIHGISSMAGVIEVQCHFPPINAIVAEPKTFRYMQLLQRGDLPVYISNAAGPVTPVRVTYTMYQLRPDGSRKQVGPSGRTPVKGVVGEFYATGRAGELGQPGSWILRWEWQRTYQSVIQYKEMCFQVFDAVLAADSRDVTVRCKKYGWN